VAGWLELPVGRAVPVGRVGLVWVWLPMQ